MKKLLIIILMGFMMIFSSCSNQTVEEKPTTAKVTEESTETAEEEKSETIIYESETGPIEVPANPKRIVDLTGAGTVLSLSGNIVGVDKWSKTNPRFEKYIEDAIVVSDESLEKIVELEPDLIIIPSSSKNIDKLKQVAPTVAFTYGKVDYLTSIIEYGKAINKEKEAKAWVDDFKVRANKIGEEIKAKIGEDATISVIESYEKELYVFGDNWGRGTEILYQEMGLKMPEKVKENALKDGYYALSAEVLPEFAGDYIIFSKDPDADHAFQETETYKNIPAVKNNRIFEVNAKAFYYNDPITLDFQLDFIKKSLLGG